MGIAQILMIATIVAPLVEPIISLIERLLTGQGKGQEKKATALGAINLAYTNASAKGFVGKDLTGVTPEMVEIVSSMLIDASVYVFNKAGIFKHTLSDDEEILPTPKIDAQ